MDDFQTKERKQAAIDVLSNYSQFVMVCLGEGVSPHQLRVHLMKEISGMPTSLEACKSSDKGKQVLSSEGSCSMETK